MKEGVSKKDFLFISLMLFGLFFGAGNLLFPPFLGKEAGGNAVIALVFFGITAVVFPILGVIAVAKSDGLQKLAQRVGPIFAALFTGAVYLAIGPGLGIPRASTMPFEMAISSYVPSDFPIDIAQLIYTAIFFLVAYWLSNSPTKLVNRMGKVLTPTLITLILLMFIGIVINPTPSPLAPVGDYASMPAVKGFLEGYNTMDTIAALNFGLVIAVVIGSKNIKEEKSVISLSIKAGLVAGTFLFAIYAMLTYIGVSSSALFPDTENGAQILSLATSFSYGKFGSMLVSVIFTLACLTTCVGLITSTGQYFTTLSDKLTYKQWVIIWTFLSFLIANFGLNTILSISVPVLVTIYPISLVLIILALTHKFYHGDQRVYRYTIFAVSLLAFIDGFNAAGIRSEYIMNILHNYLPYYSTGLGWVLPVFVVYVVMVIISKVTYKGNKQ